MLFDDIGLHELSEFFGVDKLRQRGPRVGLMYHLIHSNDFVKNHADQIILLSPVTLEFNQSFEPISMAVSQLQTLPLDQFPLTRSDLFIPHQSGDMVLLVALIEEGVALKEFTVDDEAFLLLDALELEGDVRVELIDEGEDVLEDVEILVQESLASEKLGHFLRKVEYFPSTRTEDSQLFLFEHSKTDQIHLLHSGVYPWLGVQGGFFEEALFVFEQDSLSGVLELLLPLSEEGLNVLVVLRNVVLWYEDIDVLIHEVIFGIAQNFLLIRFAVDYFGLSIRVEAQFDDEVTLNTADIQEIPPD